MTKQEALRIATDANSVIGNATLTSIRGIDIADVLRGLRRIERAFPDWSDAGSAAAAVALLSKARPSEDDLYTAKNRVYGLYMTASMAADAEK